MSTWCRILIAMFCAACILLPAACGPLANNPCSGLSADERGPVREEYLPCAGSMLESMNHLDQGLEKLATGDDRGHGEAIRSMTELRSLIDDAGGLNRLKAPWADPQLTEINRGIVSAYEIYNIESFALWHPVKKLRAKVSLHNVELARRYANEARSLYRHLK
jgi:hypothetical protein